MLDKLKQSTRGLRIIDTAGAIGGKPQASQLVPEPDARVNEASTSEADGWQGAPAAVIAG